MKKRQARLWITPAGMLVACVSGGDARSGSRSEAAAAPPPPEVSFLPSAVTLKYATREIEIQGVLAREPGSAPPPRVWLWAYFINPTEKVDGEPTGGSRSDEPIERAHPFGPEDTARIVARGPFHWATNSDAPKSGYYARVSVSARSSEDARVPVKQRDYSREHAIRVTTKQ